MKLDIINANTDLGVMIDGASLGPDKITNNLNNNNVNNVYKLYSKKINKNKDINNKKKNLNEINEFNEHLYNQALEILNKNNFPISLGGDHSIAIASSLASIKKHKNLGIIWVDAHGDYNTFETTITGNIHGLPLAVIDNYEKEELALFHQGNFYNPKNTVIVGGRDIDPLEKVNLNDAGVTIFTTEDIKQKGAKTIMEEAIKIASNNTNGIHISYDLDVIDPNICKGVSVKAKDGLNEQEAYEIMDTIITHKDKLKSFDLVEFNPLNDTDNKTLEITLNLLNKLIDNLK